MSLTIADARSKSFYCATYTRVLVSMTQKNSNVVLEDFDDVAVVVELTAVARIGAGPPVEVDLNVSTGPRQSRQRERVRLTR